MLSKYEHLKKECAAVRDPVRDRILAQTLCKNLEQRYGEVLVERILPGGTLGIFFELRIDGRRKFAKTHPKGQGYQKNLLKEIKIMSLLYEDVLAIEKVKVSAEGVQYVFMIMDQLFPCSCPPEPGTLKKWIRFYQQRLCGVEQEINYSFSQILSAGKESLEALYANKFVTREMHFQCMESLYRIEGNELAGSGTICHGDLSNVNIMQDKNGGRMIIDWEDALMAFPEYDYLYWLTFFSQRKYYGPALLRDWGVARIRGTDLMVLIMIIKCEMSVQNGSYVRHRMSFQDRIREIYEMAAV